MRMRGDLASGHVCFFSRSFQLLRGKLRSAWAVSLGKYAAGGKNLYHIHAIFHLGAYHVPDLVNAIGNLEVALFRKHADARLWRKIVQVAVSAGDGDARPAGNDAWSRDQSFVDRIAQIHGQERRRAYVAHAGKPGFKSLAGIYHGGKGALKRCVPEIIDFIIAVSARAKVRVAIDQSRKHGRV